MPPIAALDFVADPPAALPPVCVAFGDESLLKHQVRQEFRRLVPRGGDAEFSVTSFDGESVAWRDVLDELSTRSLFGGGLRLVVVEEADDFVSQHRPALEDYAARPATSAVLLLEVATFPSNTRLFKAVSNTGCVIDCSPPPAAKVAKWLIARAKSLHKCKLEGAAAETLLEVVGPELGLLDQELTKLATFAGAEAVITPRMVDDLVGGWRAKTTWEMLDTALAGDAPAALLQLDRLLLSGENPVGLLAQIGSTLRRMGAAMRLYEQAERDGGRPQFRAVLQAAGFKPFVLGKAETQLKQLGRRRAAALFGWLLEADFALKGNSAQAPRQVLETLIARLSRAVAAEAAGK